MKKEPQKNRFPQVIRNVSFSGEEIKGGGRKNDLSTDEEKILFFMLVRMIQNHFSIYPNHGFIF